jgi:hypothetical protein
MVLFLETCTAEVSYPAATHNDCSHVRGGPQGLRRPRFSFFRFTCQTARKPKSPTLQQAPKGRRSPKPPTETGAWSHPEVRSFPRSSTAPQRRAALRRGGYIVGGSHPCQHTNSQNFFPPVLCGKSLVPQGYLGSRGPRAPHSRHIPPAFLASGEGRDHSSNLGLTRKAR